MLRKVGFVVAANLLMVSAASADAPLPKDLKYVDPRVRFEGIDQYADYVFHLRFLTFSGGPAGVPYRLFQVKDSNAFNLNAQRRLTSMQLLAMERKVFDKRAKDDPSLKWLTDKTEGILPADVATPPTTASIRIKEVPVTTYRISLKDGKLAADKVETKQGSAATPAGLLPAWTFGLVSAISLAWLGIWFVRRSRVQHSPLAPAAGNT